MTWLQRSRRKREERVKCKRWLCRYQTSLEAFSKQFSNGRGLVQCGSVMRCAGIVAQGTLSLHGRGFRDNFKGNTFHEETMTLPLRVVALAVCVIILGTGILTAQENTEWKVPRFSDDAGAVYQVAATATAKKGSEVLVLYDEHTFTFDAEGKAV